MSSLQEIPGSVAAPTGYSAAGVVAGIKPSGNPDVTLIVSDRIAGAAGVFTTNRVCAAPVLVSREHLRDHRARAIAINAGCANACTGEQGLRDAYRMAEVTARLLGAVPQEILVASTGVIGRLLPMERLEAGLARAATELSPDGGARAARAIMTTDTRPKQIAVELELPGSRGHPGYAGRAVRIGGICKGSGMIQPNMATMLAFLTTDAALSPELLQSCLRDVVEQTFHCVTIDGDTSTNDTALILANGASGVRVESGTAEHRAFQAALLHVATYLARELARDGEGATKLVEIRVTGGGSYVTARQVAKAIANSPLVKTALFGNDPNWGRILCAAGYSGVEIDPARTSLAVCGIPLVRSGEPLSFDASAASRAMHAEEVLVQVELGLGGHDAIVWTCDFSYDYVRINAEYTT